MTLTLALTAGLLILSGCGSDSAGDSTPAPSSASTTQTSFGSSVTLEPSAPPTTAAPTEASTDAPESTDTSIEPTPSPTEPPLPKAGAEVLIEGNAIKRLIPGDDLGRTFYAVTAQGVFRSADGGANWAAAGVDQDSDIIAALNEPDILYSGDKGDCGRGFSFSDFTRSTDAGRTWETLAANRDVEPLLAYETQQATYVFGTDCGLQVSANGGNSWSNITDLNGEEVFSVATDRADPLKHILVVAATEGGTGRLFLLNTDNPMQPDLTGAIAQFWGDAAVAWRNGRIVLATHHMVGVSDDQGQTWSWSREGLEDATFSIDPLVDEIPAIEMDPSRGFSFVHIDENNSDHIWIGGIHGVYQSIDGGATWERLGAPVATDGLIVSPFSNRLFISSDGHTRIWTLDGQ